MNPTRGQMAFNYSQIITLLKNRPPKYKGRHEDLDQVRKNIAELHKLPLTQPNPIFVDQCHFAHCDERPVQLFEGHMYCPSCLRDMLRLRARLQEHNRQAKALKRAIATISLHQFVKIDTQRSIDETFDQEPL